MKNREGYWTVYWRNEANEAYLYGSKIKFIQKDEVEFMNDLIPPGAVIKTWHSLTRFQRDMVEPTLPMIDGEREYRVRLHADMDMKDGLLLKFLFYQKNGELEGETILRGEDMTFRCPIRTFYYEVQLICAGSHKFCFHSFSLEELEESHGVTVS